MTIEDAIIALKPYQPEPPQKALMFIRNNWNEAEPVLLAEIDRCLADPVLAEPSALFFYSLYLCAEMRCKAAFERYMEICRLQDLLRDYLIGDVLTEALSQMLALTCVNLIDELKALVEDDAAYELVRSTGLDALHDLVVIDVHPQKELSRYCIDLLAERLEKRPTYIWDVAISLAEKLRLVETLPLIETAYRCGWANPGLQSFESVRDGMAQVLTAAELSDWREKAEGFKTEREMDFFVRNWSKGHSKAEEYSAHLLQEARGQIQHSQRSAGSKVKIGRNTLCPCGSGKKYKNAASIKKNPTVTPDVLAAKPLNKADEWISVGYYYLDQDSPDKTIVWWFNGWQECENIFPTVLRDPSSSECDQLVPSSGFFSNWLQDYQSLIEDNPQRNLLMVKNGLNFCQGVVARFPDMNCLLKNNFIESTAHLLLALGKSKQAIILLEQLIDQQPHTAHGYAVLAAVLSLDAQRYNLSPDIERAKKLLLQARQNTTDYEGWDVEFRLEDLQEWQPG